MKLAVTGREGQVVRSLVEKARALADVTVISVGRPQLDLAHPETVAAAIADIEADVIVSAAAYTAVDKAEDEPELALTVNALGAGAVARAAAARGIPVIHLSTDYVFSGVGNAPYTEEDEPDPQSVYGKSKLEGERAVAAANPHHVILRTAWVYSPFGKNFARTMLTLARDRDEVTVVGDQWGNPTSALDIADAVLHIAREVMAGCKDGSFGLFHLAGTGRTSWSGFAQCLFEGSASFGGPSARVRTITTAEYPTRARRPANSCLATDKLWNVYNWRAPGWRDSARVVLERLLQTSD